LQTSFKRSAILHRKWQFCIFEPPPPFGVLWETYNDDLRLMGKHVVDFLLELIELFLLGVTAEALRAIINQKSAILLQWGPVDPKFHIKGIALPQPFFFSEY